MKNRAVRYKDGPVLKKNPILPNITTNPNQEKKDITLWVQNPQALSAVSTTLAN